MAYFTNSHELTQVMENLWIHIKGHPEMSKKLLDSKLVVQFRYREPEGIITVDCSDGLDMKIIAGATKIKPVIEMSMKADTAHQFWLGKVNVPLAIMAGKIISKGPTPRALALLPVIKPAYDIYPKVLEETGNKSA